MSDAEKSVSRRWLYIPFIIGALLFTAYGFLWRAGAHEMRRQIEVWVADQRNAGMDVAHGAITTSGFPFFLRGKIHDFELSAPGQWQWRGEALAVDALPLDLSRLIFSPMGLQHVEADGIGAWRIKGENIRASIANDKARSWVFSVTVEEAGAQRESDASEASIDALVFDLAPAANDLTTLQLNLMAKGFNASFEGGGAEIDQVNAMLALLQAEQLFAHGNPGLWRSAGGGLDIIAFEAVSDTTKITADGQLTIDENSYPAGRVNTEIANPGGLAKALGAAGILDTEEAEQTEASLTLMAMANGGKISTPIEFQNGGAEIAGVKILNFGPVKIDQP